MAAYDQGALSKYNSLTDRHLVSYFSNDRMRHHLIKNGLITKNGEVVPDAVYRVKMARREHRRRVRDLIAQAIIHKALEMERSRQIDIRKKIEEIAKIELVRRVREDRARIGDEDCISYFSPGNMDLAPRIGLQKKRTQSDFDEYRLPATPDEKSRLRLKKLLPNEEIESKHLSQLDSLTLGEYSKILLKQDQKRINKLPYLGLGKSTNGKKTKKFKSKKSRKPQKKEGSLNEELLQVDLNYKPSKSTDSEDVVKLPKEQVSGENTDAYALDSTQDSVLEITSSNMAEDIKRNSKEENASNTKNDGNNNFTITKSSRKKKKRSNKKGILKSSNLKSSRSNQSKVQSMTKLSILFHAPIQSRSYEVMVEQQPSGGNTIILYRNALTNNSIFTVISHRHKGFPFSLTFYINNVKDSRISTCCEYKHKIGKRIGGPNGHFSLFSVEGASPCFRCLTEQDMKNEEKKSGKKNFMIRENVSLSNGLTLSLFNTSYWISQNCVNSFNGSLKVKKKSEMSSVPKKHFSRKSSSCPRSRSLKVLMPYVDFYAKSKDQESKQHESISVGNNSDSPYQSDNQFESDSSSESLEESDNDENEEDNRSNKSSRLSSRNNLQNDEANSKYDSEEPLEIAVNNSESTRENEIQSDENQIIYNNNNNAFNNNKTNNSSMESNLSDNEFPVNATGITVTYSAKDKGKTVENSTDLKEANKDLKDNDKINKNLNTSFDTQNVKPEKNNEFNTNNEVELELMENSKDKINDKTESKEIKETEEKQKEEVVELETKVRKNSFKPTEKSFNEPKTSTEEIRITTETKNDLTADSRNKEENNLINLPRVSSEQTLPEEEVEEKNVIDKNRNKEISSSESEEEKNNINYYTPPKNQNQRKSSESEDSEENEVAVTINKKSVNPIKTNNRRGKLTNVKQEAYSSESEEDEENSSSSSEISSSIKSPIPSKFNNSHSKPLSTVDKGDLKIDLPNDDIESNELSASDKMYNGSNDRNYKDLSDKKRESFDDGERNTAKTIPESSSESESESEDESLGQANIPEVPKDISPDIKPDETLPTEDVIIQNDDINFKKAKELIQRFTNININSFKITSCELPSYVFNFIAEKLELHHELKSIELSECEVEISLLNLLAKSLDKWPKLEQLILSNNQFVDYSLQNLIDKIKFLYHCDRHINTHKQNLKVFDLSNCSIKENDFGLVTDMIKSDTRVENIVMNGNPLSLDMLKDICNALNVNTQTKIISLENCGILQSMLELLNEFGDSVKKRLKI